MRTAQKKCLRLLSTTQDHRPNPSFHGKLEKNVASCLPKGANQSARTPWAFPQRQRDLAASHSKPPPAPFTMRKKKNSPSGPSLPWDILMGGRRAQAHAVPRGLVRPDAIPERSFPHLLQNALTHPSAGHGSSSDFSQDFEPKDNPNGDFPGTSELSPRL